MPIERDGVGERTFFGKKKKPSGLNPVAALAASVKPMPMGQLIPQQVQQSIFSKSKTGVTFPWEKQDNVAVAPAASEKRFPATLKDTAAKAKAALAPATPTAPAAPTTPVGNLGNSGSTPGGGKTTGAGPTGELGLSRTKKSRGRRGRITTLLSSAGGPAETFGG